MNHCPAKRHARQRDQHGGAEATSLAVQHDEDCGEAEDDSDKGQQEYERQPFVLLRSPRPQPVRRHPRRESSHQPEIDEKKDIACKQEPKLQRERESNDSCTDSRHRSHVESSMASQVHELLLLPSSRTTAMNIQCTI